jgi:hypothetical protein
MTSRRGTTGRFEVPGRAETPRHGAGGRPLAASALAALVMLLAAPLAQASSATSGAFPDLPWGAEGAVSGAGASASVSDATALFWNPARMLAVDRRSFMAGTGDLYGEGIVSHSFAALALPVRSQEVGFDSRGRVVKRPGEVRSAFGLAADVLTFDAADDIYRETRIALSYAKRALGGSAFGLTIKYLSVDGDIDELQASGYDLDAAIESPLTSWMRGGLLLRHALSSLSWDGGSDERLNFRAVGGLFIRLRHDAGVPLGAVWDPEGVGLQELSASVRVTPLGGIVSLFGGWRLRPEDDKDVVGSAGAAISWKRVSAGYSLTEDEAGVGSTHRFNAGIEF